MVETINFKSHKEKFLMRIWDKEGKNFILSKIASWHGDDEEEFRVDILDEDLNMIKVKGLPIFIERIRKEI